MKKVLILMTFMLAAIVGWSQSAKKDSSGNYVALASHNRVSVVKETGKTYTDAKGNKYPVYISASGKLFIKRVSAKTGKEYNSYLKISL